MGKIKAVQIFKPEDLRIIDMDMPVIDEKNNVLVKIAASGICGSDVGIYHGQNAAATYPRVIGHEIVGEVVEAGPTATKVKVGDRVIIDQVTDTAGPAATAVRMSASILRCAASISTAATVSTWRFRTKTATFSRISCATRTRC